MKVNNNFKIAITDDTSVMRCRLLIHLIKSCGATPVLIPMVFSSRNHVGIGINYDVEITKHLAKVDNLLSMCDGIILPGNRLDIHPNLYNEQHIHQATAKKLPHDSAYVRQETEVSMLKYALKQPNMPLLAICGGMHLVNAVLGGSLNQHLPEDKRVQLANISHYDSNLSSLTAEQLEDFEANFDSFLTGTRDNIYTGTHTIKVAKGSMLADIYQKYNSAINLDEIQELSIHHQGCFAENLSTQLKAVAWSADGVVEAAEHVDRESMFLLTQFHPECNVSNIARGLIKRMIEEIDNV